MVCQASSSPVRTVWEKVTEWHLPVCLNPELMAARITINTNMELLICGSCFWWEKLFAAKASQSDVDLKKKSPKRIWFQMDAYCILFGANTFAFLPLHCVWDIVSVVVSQDTTAFPELKYCHPHLVKSVLASAQTFLPVLGPHEPKLPWCPFTNITWWKELRGGYGTYLGARFA